MIYQISLIHFHSTIKPIFPTILFPYTDTPRVHGYRNHPPVFPIVGGQKYIIFFSRSCETVFSETERGLPSVHADPFGQISFRIHALRPFPRVIPSRAVSHRFTKESEPFRHRRVIGRLIFARISTCRIAEATSSAASSSLFSLRHPVYRGITASAASDKITETRRASNKIVPRWKERKLKYFRAIRRHTSQRDERAERNPLPAGHSAKERSTMPAIAAEEAERNRKSGTETGTSHNAAAPERNMSPAPMACFVSRKRSPYRPRTKAQDIKPSVRRL